MLGVDERRHAAGTLRLGNHLQCQRRLSRRFGTENLGDPATWQPADPEGIVDTDGACGDRLDRRNRALSEAHDRALAKLFLDLSNGDVEGSGAFLEIIE